MFQNESLESIMNKLARWWHDLDVFYLNEQTKKYSPVRHDDQI